MVVDKPSGWKPKQIPKYLVLEIWRQMWLCGWLSDLAAQEIQVAINRARRLNSPYVFPGIRDPQKPMKDPRKAFIWILENAGLDHRRIHDLRHSFISMGVNMGENIMAIKDAAGHSRVTTTESYSHMSDYTTFTAVNNIANAMVE